MIIPVYTGRAKAGLTDLIRKGEFGKVETIVLWVTGRYATLFAYAEQLMAAQKD